MAEIAQQKENKMGVMPINKLLLSMALPIMISMLVQAMYNVVDSIFVSRVSENALTAVSLAFPIQNLMIAIGAGTGVGINALLSKSLGEKNFDEADKAANNGIFLAFLSWILFLIFGFICTNLFFTAQTNDLEIIELGNSYLSVVCIFSFGIFGQIVFERLLQSTGKTIYTMISQGVGAIVNIVLDPIFIFGYLGMPEMGVTGAAVATVIGQIVGALLGLYFNIAHNHEINLRFKTFKPNLNTIKKIYAVGLPSIIMLSIATIMTFGMNKILLTFSSTAAAVFGIYFKLQSFIFMPVFGLNNGIVPIISYNYGARKKDRMIKTIKLSILYAIFIMAIGVMAFRLKPDVLLSMFEASEDMMAIGIPALKTISLSFIFAGFSIIVGSVFQALGNGVFSLIVSVTRQLIFLLPSAFVFSKLGNIDLVWWAFPLAEVVALVLSAIFMRKIYVDIIKDL